ncbi:hypothetical protein Tco_1001110 [Tanacetum coccineum]
MAFSVILISSDSSEESVGTSTARVILSGTIPTTISPSTPTTNLPVIHDDTLLTPSISPTIPTIPPVAPTIQYISPFINTDLSNSDAPDSPPSQDLYETVVAYRFLLVDLIIPIPMLTARKSVGSLPTHRLASRYPSDSSSSDSSLRYSSSSYAISETSCDSPTTASERPSRKRCRSPSVPVSSPVRRALSPVSLEDGYELYVPREVGLGVDIEDRYEPYTEPDINSDIQADIDECIAYADAIRAREMDDRDVVETAAEEEVGSRERHADGAVEVIESEQRLQGHRITGVDLEVTTMT